MLVGESVVLPIFTTLVYACVWADAGDGTIGGHAIWERVLERAWAVIVIDFATSTVVDNGYAALYGGGTVEAVFAVLAFALGVLLIFADASATVDDGVSVWMLLPHAFAKSVVTVVRARVLMRALAIFSLWLLVQTGELWLIAALRGAHVAQAEFWVGAVVDTLAVVPFSALILVVYRDATEVSEG